MIRAATLADLQRLSPDSEAALKLLALADAYGVDRPFLRFYRSDSGCVFARIEDSAILCADADADLTEVSLFLQMDSEVRRIRTDEDTARVLATAWGVDPIGGPVLTPHTAFVRPPQVTDCPPKAAYAVLSAVFGKTIPPFDIWYADVHHRRRRGLCRVVAVEQAGEPVAVAMTTAMTTDAALIGGVATLPAHRGHGYATACVAALTADCQAEGRRVLLSPKNAHAEAIYTRMGFVPCGRFGEIYIGKDT